MRIDNARLRLPSVLPIRPRGKADPIDFDSGDCHADMTAPGFNYSPTTPPVPEEDGRYAQTWQEHVPHTGRRPPTKGTASFRGSTTDGDRNEIVFESTLELAGADIVKANSKAKRLQSQVGPVHHLDEGGDVRRPIFDFVVTGEADRTLAIAIKPKRKRASSGIDDTIAAVREQRPDFSDDVAVWTEDALPRSAEHNAGLILRSRRLRNEADVAALTEAASRTRGAVRIGQFLQSFRSDGRGFTAIVNLIDDGVLVPVDRGRISPGLLVRFAA
jgi:hypothetical protein